MQRSTQYVHTGSKSKVSPADLDRLVTQHASKIEAADAASGSQSTFFEVMTALAIQHFADRGVRWAIFEAGMGGITDATNVFSPEQVLI
jgi:folylpolyglutamate synthase/dihydropteroate synthase